ncbi:MFS transporter [Gordonia sp. ABSL11-1]|uniref:MFS transporter n=1 Tax=Gordonia sp. ABSL11-1 TaxID=3053924 RepID=UPI00257456EF|nr:MFS transporter [Gordonia sp. ABSL11-1]MDL9945496.1 MFS transporter [Gordonia sp. ABSL11-1]
MTRLRSADLRSIWLIAIACAAVSMVVAAMAALNTALPDIAIDTGADSGQMTWIVDGYTLALAALLLPAGAVGDRYGRRGVLIVGLFVFAIASVLPVWISDPTQLIATRVLAGVGAALIMPTTLSLITSGVPESRRALGVSIWAAVAGGGAIAGFLVTGILLEFFTWHSIFITFAASAVLTAALCFTIGSSRDSSPGRFDVAGSLTSILGITGIVLGLLEAPHRGWADPLVLIGLIGGIVLVVAFVFLELRRASPLLDVRLFTNRAFGSGSLAIAMQFFASFGVFYLMLQQLQLVFGYSPLQSAFALMPMVAGVGIFALLGNWLAVRFDALRFVLAGGILLAGVGIVLLGIVHYETYWTAIWIIVLCAIGIGLATASSTTAIMSNTPLDNQGVGSAVNDTAREIGAAIGIAVAGSIMAAGYSNRIGAVADNARTQLTAAGEQRIAAGDQLGGQMLVQQAGQAADHIRRSLAEATAVVERLADRAGPLAAQIAHDAQDAFLEPMRQAYIVLGAVLVASAFVLAWLAPRRVVTVSPDAPTAGDDIPAADGAAQENVGVGARAADASAPPRTDTAPD